MRGVSSCVCSLGLKVWLMVPLACSDHWWIRRMFGRAHRYTFSFVPKAWRTFYQTLTEAEATNILWGFLSATEVEAYSRWMSCVIQIIWCSLAPQNCADGGGVYTPQRSPTCSFPSLLLRQHRLMWPMQCVLNDPGPFNIWQEPSNHCPHPPIPVLLHHSRYLLGRRSPSCLRRPSNS